MSAASEPERCIHGYPPGICRSCTTRQRLAARSAELARKRTSTIARTKKAATSHSRSQTPNQDSRTGTVASSRAPLLTNIAPVPPTSRAKPAAHLAFPITQPAATLAAALQRHEHQAIALRGAADTGWRVWTLESVGSDVIALRNSSIRVYLPLTTITKLVETAGVRIGEASPRLFIRTSSA